MVRAGTGASLTMHSFSRLAFLALEPRLVFDGALATTAADDHPPDPSTDAAADSTSVDVAVLVEAVAPRRVSPLCVIASP